MVQFTRRLVLFGTVCVVATIVDRGHGLSVVRLPSQYQSHGSQVDVDVGLHHDRHPPPLRPVFLSPDQLSSPQRYADALNMTLQQVQDRKDEFRNASENLRMELQSLDEQSRLSLSSSNSTMQHTTTPTTTFGEAKHALICEHRYSYGHHPFVCPRCWSYTPICVCSVAEWHKSDRNYQLQKEQQQQQDRIHSSERTEKSEFSSPKSASASSSSSSLSSSSSWLPPNLDAVIWTHHREWGLTSNTGGLLPLILSDDEISTDTEKQQQQQQEEETHDNNKSSHHDENNNNNVRCCLRMKGLPAHDEWMQHALFDNHDKGEYLVVVLWPEGERKQKRSNEKLLKTTATKSSVGQTRDSTSISLDEIRKVLGEIQAEAHAHQEQQGQHSSSSSTSTSKTVDLDEEESKDTIKHIPRRVVLIAVDGTWRNARKMVSRLPPSIPRLDLSSMDTDPLTLLQSLSSSSSSSLNDDETTSSTPSTHTTTSTTTSKTSLLAPIRKRGSSQRNDGGDGLVCTAEAVTAALVALGADPMDGDRIIDLAKTKVEMVRRYRGHESKAFVVTPK